MTLETQRSALATVQSLIAAGNARLEALDAGLRPEIRTARIAAIRDETTAAITATLVEMRDRRKQAEAGLPHWTQDAALRRAKFSEDPAQDARQRLAVFETLRRCSPAELFRHLEDAIREKSPAKAEAVRLEFECRDEIASEQRIEFRHAFTAVIDEPAKAMERELSLIAGLASHAETLAGEFVRGQSDPAGRMTTARAAGLTAVAA